MSRQTYMQTRPKNKYGNRKTEVDGHTFDSKKEAMRYAELKMLEKAGAIKDLRLQVPFELQKGFRDKYGKWQRPITYIADFTYFRQGEFVIEDVKSAATRDDTVYRMKKKMMMFKGNYISEV